MRRRASVQIPLLALPCALAALAYAPGAAVAQDARGSGASQAAPDAPDYVVEALDLYRRPPSRYEAGQLVSRWLAEGGPRNARDSLVVARLWNAASATAWALAWLPSPPASDPELADLARLERARALLGRMPIDGLPSSTDAGVGMGAREFWSVCASPYPAVAEALWLDVRGLLTPDEREAWEGAGGDERCAVLHSVFAERAWRGATTPGARLARHYRRLARARGCCWITRPREQDPFSSAWFRGRPEGLEVDDRGLLLLRMGAPDHVESNVLPDATPAIAETWVYERPDGAWIFYFVPGDFRAGYVLTERFGPQSLPGTGFYQRYMTRLALGRGSARRLLFSHQSTDAVDAALDRVEERATGRRLQMAARELQTRAITEVPDAPALEPRLAMRVQTLGFWNPRRETATVWILASVRAGDLEAVREAEAPVFALEGRLAWLRGEHSGDSGLLVHERTVPASGVAPDDAVEFRMAAELPPGRWPTTFAVRDEGATEAASGAWIQDTLVVPDLRSPLPALSDLALSPDSGGTWTRDGEVFLSPSPSHLTDPDGFVHLYFEVYGFRPGSEYDLDVRVVPADEADRIWTVDPESTAFRLAFRSTMPEGRAPIGTHHIRLDLSGAAPGEYVIGVRAQDARTRRLSLPTTAALLVRPGR